MYSLRHHYATQRLLEGIPIPGLAEQMGTGLVMPLISQNSELTDDFENRLKDQRNKSTCSPEMNYQP